MSPLVDSPSGPRGASPVCLGAGSRKETGTGLPEVRRHLEPGPGRAPPSIPCAHPRGLGATTAPYEWDESRRGSEETPIHHVQTHQAVVRVIIGLGDGSDHLEAE